MSPMLVDTRLSDAVERALNELNAGRCVAIPTETVYGLAADATNGRAVAEIFAMKGRPKFNPLLCHVCDLEMAEHYGVFDPLSRKLAGAFWPGPLTLVVPIRNPNNIHPLVSADLPTLGLRCPKGIARELIKAFGKPLAAPSANRSGRISPTTADHVADEFPDSNLLVLDAGHSECGLESTIVKVEGERVVILRPGSITDEMVREVCGCEIVRHEGDDIEAPGMMKSHYAPEASVILNCEVEPEGGAWLQFGPDKPTKLPSRNLSAEGSLTEAAANLYGYLKELDELSVGQISVSPIPASGIGIAINDRLARAAAPRESI